jgi:hypothetical protein
MSELGVPDLKDANSLDWCEANTIELESGLGVCDIGAPVANARKDHAPSCRHQIPDRGVRCELLQPVRIS